MARRRARKRHVKLTPEQQAWEARLLKAIYEMDKPSRAANCFRPLQPRVLLTISHEIGLGWEPQDSRLIRPVSRNEALGSKLAPPGNEHGSGRELVIGLDFGTSSTKVVIADRAMNMAYAVPFMDAVGVASYLLPSALVETSAGVCSLSDKGERHTDLKLSMLADVANDQACTRVCAYLALVIRHARAWLYETKGDQYLNADILWTLAIGQPTDQATSDQHRKHFEDIAKVAWQLAGSKGRIRVDAALRMWSLRQNLSLDDELEVRAIPELSAQIHGFVSSSHFDTRQPNIFLLVDVGAGTLDASLFHVKKGRGGAVSFSFYTHSVEPLGAANLNRARLGWWQKQLCGRPRSIDENDSVLAARIAATAADLGRLQVPTELQGSYPDSYSRYVKGVQVKFEGGATSPDEDFYQRVRNQVAGKVLYGAWKRNLLTQSAVKDLPFFLCGGGGRHPLFAALKSRLQNTEGCSWLSAQPRELVLPANVSAPGVANCDYDRLSVAYGLSQLNGIASSKVAALLPVVPDSTSSDWISTAADKSVC